MKDINEYLTSEVVVAVYAELDGRVNATREPVRIATRGRR